MERTYIVECYWPGVTEPAHAVMAARADAAARAFRSDGRLVRFLDSLLVPADEAAYYRFAGECRRDVEAVCTDAQLPFERIVEYVDVPARSDRTHRTERQI